MGRNALNELIGLSDELVQRVHDIKTALELAHLVLNDDDLCIRIEDALACSDDVARVIEKVLDKRK